MTRDDMNRWEAEIESWRQRLRLADKQSYELGLLHGAAAERTRFADECIDLVAMHGGPVDLEAAIRARSNT